MYTIKNKYIKMARKNYRKGGNRKYRTARYKGSLGTSVQRMPGVAERQIVKLKYAQQTVLNPSAGVASQHLFRANSINDPDFSTGGHQPMAHDQWATFYNHYTVIGSRCKATFWGGISESPGQDTTIVGIYLDDTATAVPEITELLEQGKTRPRYLSSGDGGRAVQTVTSNYSAKKHFGLQSIRDNRTIIGAQFGSNPSEDMYFHVFASSATDGVDGNPVTVLLEIEYIAYLTEPKSLDQS